MYSWNVKAVALRIHGPHRLLTVRQASLNHSIQISANAEIYQKSKLEAAALSFYGVQLCISLTQVTFYFNIHLLLSSMYHLFTLILPYIHTEKNFKYDLVATEDHMYKTPRLTLFFFGSSVLVSYSWSVFTLLSLVCLNCNALGAKTALCVHIAWILVRVCGHCCGTKDKAREAAWLRRMAGKTISEYCMSWWKSEHKE